MNTMSFDPVQATKDETRERLTRELITDAALDLLDEVGIDMLSTRRLASKLGIQSASLYWHFKNKDQLFDAMSSQLFSLAVSEPNTDAPEFDWADWIADGARAIRRTALNKRDGARLMSRTRKMEPEKLKLIARHVSVLSAHGLTETDAQAALQTLRRFAVGSALQEQANMGKADMVPGLQGDALFEFGLKLITDSLRRLGDARNAGVPES